MDSDQMTPADGISKLVAQYNSDVTEIENAALYEKKRAYGGIVRSSKGQLVEELCRNVVRIAWSDLGRDPNRLTFVTSATEIPLKRDYLERIKNREVREFIKRNVKDYYYKLKTDVHVQVDDEFAIGIECKAYTENAMLKRILVDFTLLKSIFPDLDCVLFQLESQLGGDYSEIRKQVTLGSESTHTLFSYFDVDLYIITLLEGERKVDEPIHKKGFYKPLTEISVQKAVNVFKSLLQDKG